MLEFLDDKARCNQSGLIRCPIHDSGDHSIAHTAQAMHSNMPSLIWLMPCIRSCVAHMTQTMHPPCLHSPYGSGHGSIMPSPYGSGHGTIMPQPVDFLTYSSIFHMRVRIYGMRPVPHEKRWKSKLKLLDGLGISYRIPEICR